MIKNKAQIASHKRAMSTDEQQQLEYLLTESLSPRKRRLKAILNTFVVWGALLFALLMLSGLFSYLALQSPIFSNILLFPHLQLIAVLTTALIAIASTYLWLKKLENLYPLILQDLQSLNIIDESYIIQDVCRFQEPQHGGYIYFLKVSEQAVFVIYDYQSQSVDQNINKLTESPFLVLNKLMISSAALSGYCLKYTLSGHIVAISATYPLTLPPENWPLSETWSSTSWSKLAKVYS